MEKCMILGVIVIALVGAVCCVMGWLLWKKERITLLHDYHYDQVSEADKTDFCRLSGWGVLAIGIGLLFTAVILLLTESAWSFLAFAAGFALGLFFLIYAGKRYNSK